MDLFHYFHFGNFLILNLIAASTNALNGVLLAQRPDYYRKNHWTVIGLLLLALFGGIGGGVARDLLLSKVPAALVNPWYLIVCLLAGIIGMVIQFRRGQQFRETLYQYFTSFSLPWYAAAGVQAGLDTHLPAFSCILLGIIGPTAGRYLIDITAGQTAKQFVRSEWFVGTAVLTSLVYLGVSVLGGFSLWPATLLSVIFGFFFRVAALWFNWEEPMPKIPADLLGGIPKRTSLKEKWHGRKDDQDA